MIPLRDVLNFNLMMAFYLQGQSVARHSWEAPINYHSGYIFTAEDQTADDWMVVADTVTEEEESND